MGQFPAFAVRFGSPAMALCRRRYWFEGRVQGVGFRYTTERLAGNLPVSGYVRNLDDGRVELVVEGESPDIESLLNSVSEVFENRIRGVRVEDLPAADPPLVGFSIRY
jgi:acylphosphatase